MGTFVRKSFYTEPPQNGSVEEWKQWLRKDNHKARAHKAQYTRTQAHTDIPESMQEVCVRKVNGKWTQTTAIGFSGNEGSRVVEPIVESTQEKQIILARMEAERNKGGGKSGSSARKNRARKARRKARS